MKKILVADDMAASRELIRTVLVKAGYEVVEAENGASAVDQARLSNPDLILLDLQMPALDGFGALAELRSHGQFTHTPIVALTASAMDGDSEKALAAGFNAYITKPVGLRELRAQVARLLE